MQTSEPELTLDDDVEWRMYHMPLAVKALGFFDDHRERQTFDQMSLWTTKNHVNDNFNVKLGSGCGSFKLLNSPYTDKDFVVPIEGTEFLTEYVKDLENISIWKGQKTRVCRPVIRLLKPKTCLSYHKDDSQVRIHVVLKTHEGAMFIVDEKMHRMPKPGSVYVLRTDRRHTAINAHLNEERIHLTFSAYPENQFPRSSK